MNLKNLSAKLNCDYSVLDILSENLPEFLKEEFKVWIYPVSPIALVQLILNL